MKRRDRFPAHARVQYEQSRSLERVEPVIVSAERVRAEGESQGPHHRDDSTLGLLLLFSRIASRVRLGVEHSVSSALPCPLIDRSSSSRLVAANAERILAPLNTTTHLDMSRYDTALTTFAYVPSWLLCVPSN